MTPINTNHSGNGTGLIGSLNAEKKTTDDQSKIPEMRTIREQLEQNATPEGKARIGRRNAGRWTIGIAVGIATLAGLAVLAGLVSNPVGWAILGGCAVGVFVGIATVLRNKGNILVDIIGPLTGIILIIYLTVPASDSMAIYPNVLSSPHSKESVEVGGQQDLLPHSKEEREVLENLPQKEKRTYDKAVREVARKGYTTAIVMIDEVLDSKLDSEIQLLLLSPSLSLLSLKNQKTPLFKS